MDNLTKNLRRGWTLWMDDRVPWAARGVLVFALSYSLWPYDLIPDSVPVLGYVDDLCVTLIGFLIAKLLIPAAVFNEYRHGKRQALIMAARGKGAHDKKQTFILIGILLIVLVLSFTAAHSHADRTHIYDHFKALAYVLTFD